MNDAALSNPRNDQLRWLVFVIASIGVLGASAAAGDSPTATVSENRFGKVFQLTNGPKTDEDGSFIGGDDGKIYFAFISNRSGNMDVWLTSSKDGQQWSEPHAVVATPHDDLLNVFTRTSDGIYHLTGRSQFMVADSTSSNLVEWSAPVAWSNPRTDGWTAGSFQEAAHGEYWLVTLSEKTGVRKLYIQNSSDRGRNWSARAPLTQHEQADFLFSFRIAADGTFILVWEQRDVRDQKTLVSASSNIYASTSKDGIKWTAPALLSPPTGKPKLDMWPSIIVGPRDQYYAVWMSSRVATPESPGGAVMVPVYPRLDAADLRAVPASGYSVRSQRLADGRFLLAWVQKTKTNPTLDYYYRIVADFEFDPVKR
jgi:hypothetical protein